MSYILDALRKSEQSRRPGGPVGSSGAVHELRVPIPTRGWLLALGLALLFSLLAGSFIFWRGLSQSETTLPPPVAGAETLAPPDPAALVANVVPAVTERLAREVVPVPESSSQASWMPAVQLADRT